MFNVLALIQENVKHINATFGGSTLLHELCQVTGTANVVKYLCDQQDIDVNAKDLLDCIPLCYVLQSINELDDKDNKKEIRDAMCKVHYLIKAKSNLEHPWTFDDDFEVIGECIQHIKNYRDLDHEDFD